jgi:threonine aldolase
LEKSPSRLHIDHQNARHLAEGVAKIPGFAIDPTKVRTNIVIFDCSNTGKTAVEWCDILYQRGLWAQDTAPHSLRLVTHGDVDAADIERALIVLQDAAMQVQKVGA